ncbi:MAG: hypothetical protein M1830_003140, partial [Pleopsidium flavum]
MGPGPPSKSTESQDSAETDISHPLHRRSGSKQAQPPSPRSPGLRLHMSETPAQPTMNRKDAVSPPITAKSDSPFGQLSPGNTDRVFPIRSVVSVDPTPTPLNRPDGARSEGFRGMNPPSEGIRTPRGHSNPRRIIGEPSTDRSSDTSHLETPSKPQSTPSGAHALSGYGALDRRRTLDEGSGASGSTSGDAESLGISRQMTFFTD